ncbi:S1/P1 nuclease-like protein [Halenospora varia]|nr:S1/P1 nuclease-like protein [Halenospora varia]
MKFPSTAPIVLLTSCLPSALCWGVLGHETVAYVASNFVTSATQTKFQTILGDTSANYLASIAAYADTYRSTTAGKFSAPYHYIDALDNPPQAVVWTMHETVAQEVTARVQSTSLSAADVTLAAKMLVHFLGDIHQPLHDENLEVGGNNVPVTFDGVSTNLHAVWDTSIPQKYAGTATLAHAKTWADTLTTAIKTGSYKSSAASWLTGMTLKDPVSSSMIWATDSNSYVCSTVMPNGYLATESGDLSGDYYAEALPIVQIQIAKAGYRLAAWLNLIATGSTGL